jgi:threonylcarbamoyladenosine tRNA methylthiotransferase MtaB
MGPTIGTINMKKACVFSNNYCNEAMLETQRLINIISKAGAQPSYLYTNKIDDADLIIFYTCGHLQANEAESISTIRRILSKKRASSELIVWGCLPKINPESLRRVFGGTMVGPEDWAFFYELFGQPKGVADGVYANALSVDDGLGIVNISPFWRVHLRFRRFLDVQPKRIWYIRIESGCANCCTYCSDRLAYRSVRSQPIERIIQQFSLGLRNGYKYFFFVGRDLGSYGCDMGLSLASLLQAIYEKYPHQDYKLLLDQVSPDALVDIYPDLNSSILSNKVFELGSNIQSGSDRILKLMGKRFKLYDWIRVIKSISRDHPQIRLHTSMMVGFPSESEQDFRESINLVNTVLFDNIAVYIYNERPGLPSLRIKGRVPENTKRKREQRMIHIANLNVRKKRISRSLHI